MGFFNMCTCACVSRGGGGKSLSFHTYFSTKYIKPENALVTNPYHSISEVTVTVIYFISLEYFALGGGGVVGCSPLIAPSDLIPGK